MLKSISNQYAQAIFELSADNYMFYFDQLETINYLIENNKDFKVFLNHPKITNHEKKNVFTETLVDFDELVLNFIFVLIDNNRINLLDSIIQSYKQLYNDKNNIMEFDIISATSLLDSEIEEIKDRLRLIYNKNIFINVLIDSDNIGGLIIKHNDQVIDDSVLTRIRNIRDFLKNRKLR